MRVNKKERKKFARFRRRRRRFPLPLDSFALLSRARAVRSPLFLSLFLYVLQNPRNREYLGCSAGEDGEEHGRAGERHGLKEEVFLFTVSVSFSAATRFFWFGERDVGLVSSVGKEASRLFFRRKPL